MERAQSVGGRSVPSTGPTRSCSLSLACLPGIFVEFGVNDWIVRCNFKRLLLKFRFT